MIACVPVTPAGEIDHRWGRARRVAIAEVRGGQIARWDEVDVGWDTLHDEGTEGGHHARVARFLKELSVDLVVADHMGDPMLTMLGRMGIGVSLGAGGDARRAVVAAAASAHDAGGPDA